MKLFILLVVLITADGTPKTSSTLVDKCPDAQATEVFFNAKKNAGEIRGWNALCLETSVPRGPGA
jgi:hypothetical protein